MFVHWLFSIIMLAPKVAMGQSSGLKAMGSAKEVARSHLRAAKCKSRGTRTAMHHLFERMTP